MRGAAFVLGQLVELASFWTEARDDDDEADLTDAMVFDDEDEDDGCAWQ